jgi:hypothetical protein
MGKAMRPVTMLKNVFPLHIIQEQTDFLRAQMLMVQPLDEIGNGALKINIIFPEGIVAVDKEGLRNHSQKIYHGDTEARRKAELNRRGRKEREGKSPTITTDSR